MRSSPRDVYEDTRHEGAHVMAVHNILTQKVLGGGKDFCL